jgi:exodeoxyribonuclease-5
VELTKEQRHVIKQLLKFEKPVQTMGGYAGTGKTTIIGNIIKALPNFAVCAYTGKASHVLRKKGISEAKTIHSLIYEPKIDHNNEVYFDLAEQLPCAGIIVDEASMVSKDIYQDLLYFKKPIIFVGDHGQLEPVGDAFNVMQKPDYTLEEIHRNAGEIAHFADFIRKGFKPAAWEFRGSGKKVKFLNKNNYKGKLLEVDQVICAFNKTRAEINLEARKMLGLPPEPAVGYRVMCLRNQHQIGVFNGMQGVIAKLLPKNKMIFEADGIQYEVKYDKKVFGQEKYEFEFEKDAPLPFDWCYGTTCHKVQGSEYERTLVVEQNCGLWDNKRWSYTAASRAREEVWWVAA